MNQMALMRGPNMNYMMSGFTYCNALRPNPGICHSDRVAGLKVLLDMSLFDGDTTNSFCYNQIFLLISNILSCKKLKGKLY